MANIEFPAHCGMAFTSTIHDKPEGATDPRTIELPANFVVLITGAGKGVGYHIALAYAQAGAKGIAIASRTQTDLDKLEAEIKKTHPRVQVLSQACDTTKDEDVQRLAAATEERFGRLDVAIANAGIVSSYITKSDGKKYTPTTMIEDGDFSRVLETNIMGSYRLAKSCIPLLQATKGGPQAFVVISSVASTFPDSTLVPMAYNLSKHFLNRMVEGLDADHEDLQAFAVHPGAVLTAQTEKHHTTQLGQAWNELLVDDPGLCGGFLTWLTREKRPWLSGRYLSSNYDVAELEARKDEIVAKDLLKARLAV